MSIANKLQELIDVKQEIYTALESKIGTEVSKNMHDWAQIIEGIQTGENYSFENGVLTLSDNNEVRYKGQIVSSIKINNTIIWQQSQN